MKLKIVLTFLVLAFTPLTTLAQTPNPKSPDKINTKSPMLYHNGPVVWFPPSVYVIWYGCWDNNCGNVGDTDTTYIVADFLTRIGGSPYFQINSTYPDGAGQAPTGAVFYGGAVTDNYSHGMDLTDSGIQGVVNDQIVAGHLPLDTSGVYVVIASADVASSATGFCNPSAHPHHGVTLVVGTPTKYAFVGNAMRCPSEEAPQFMSNGTMLPTPNGSFAADAMASTLAHVLSTVVTNPLGGGWYDKYGLENADKCEGQFGQTYLTPNGARANIKLGQRDYLIQSNWVNDRKGHCAMSASQ